MKCTYCNRELDDTSNFCTYCGSFVKPGDDDPFIQDFSLPSVPADTPQEPVKGIPVYPRDNLTFRIVNYGKRRCVTKKCKD